MIDLKAKKLFLLDMDGTIYLGDNLFESTRAFLEQIKKQGGRYLFVTNNSSRSVDAYVERLHRMGLEFITKEDFLTSVDTIIWYMRGKYDDALIYASGTESFKEQLIEAGYNITCELSDDIKLLVQGFDTELTFKKLEDSCKLLTKGVDFLATNPDWVCPTAWGSVPDCGSVCQMLTTATGKKPKFIGKPEPEMAFLSMEKYGVSKEETVIVGDRIYTDVACGVNAGIDAAFVLSGEGVVEDIEKFNVHPSETYGSIADMLNEMKR